VKRPGLDQPTAAAPKLSCRLLIFLGELPQRIGNPLLYHYRVQTICLKAKGLGFELLRAVDLAQHCRFPSSHHLTLQVLPSGCVRKIC